MDEARFKRGLVLALIGVCLLMGAWCLEAGALPHVVPGPGLPPPLPYYGGPYDVHAEYPQGVTLYKPVHHTFTDIVRFPDGLGTLETFDSILDALVDLPAMGMFNFPVRLTGPVTVRLFDYTDGDLGVIDTEIVSMSLSGSVGPSNVVVRESPNLPSHGQTSVTDLGGGLYEIDSFFDVFTELSVDSGPFYPDMNYMPAHMETCPEPATLSLLALGGLAFRLRSRRAFRLRSRRALLRRRRP